MKRIAILVLCAAALCLPLTGCKGKEPDMEGEPEAENIVFTGTIEEVGEDIILVSTTDDVGFTRASVSFDAAMEASLHDFKIGQQWLITILPVIRESYPVQVTAVALEILYDTMPVPKNNA